VIEATTTDSNGNGRVFYWSYANSWDDGDHKDVKEYYVDGASWMAYTNVVRFAAGQVMKPYSIWAALYDQSAYYCSKLVWAAWNYAGYDLRKFNEGIFLPSGIGSSNKTRLYANIGRGTVDYR